MCMCVCVCVCKKLLDLARNLKKLLNMNVTMILIPVGALGIVTKGLERGLEELKITRRTETFYSTLGHSVWFVTILNSLKTNIFARLKSFGITNFIEC